MSGQVGNRGDYGRLLSPRTAKTKNMQIRKIIQRRIRRNAGGVDLIGDVNAAISANVGERSSTSHVSSRSSVSAQSVRERRGETSDAAEDQGRTDG
jgi:Holliday junction resolvase-like predicted endonuclease